MSTGVDASPVATLQRLHGQLETLLGLLALAGAEQDAHIGARKAMEVELAESREWQQLAVAAGELNLWQVDVASGARRGGAFDGQLFGFAPSSLQQVEALIHPEDRDRVNAAWQHSVATGSPYSIDYRIVPEDGVVRWLQVRGKRMRGNAGTLQMVGVTRDISEQVQAEADLHDAVQRAHAASAAKSAFLASISHELRTPLNAVIGFSGLLSQAITTPQAQAQLRALDMAARQLFSLINDVLDFSRIEAGEMTIESIPFCMLECLENALELVAGVAESKGLCLVMTARGALDRQLLGDPTRIGQVAANLLSNAVKFCAHGTVTLELLIESQAQRAAVGIRVLDTGVGMSEAELSQLFQPFRQADASTTRRYGGTGLGLSICKRLLDLMGATIEVQSAVGKGSCFEVWLSLPFAEPLAQPLTVFAQQQAGIAVSHPALREALCTQLKEAGMLAEVLAIAPLRAQGEVATAPLDVLVLESQVLESLQAADWPLGRTGRPLPVIVLVEQLHPNHNDWVQGLGAHCVAIGRTLRPRSFNRALAQVLGGIVDSFGLPAAAAMPKAQERFRRLRVLVAEDNELNQMLVLLQLQSLGIEATLVSDGNAVLRALAKERFDVVLMDVEMPELDGLQAAARIRDAPGVDERPYVIALTAHVLSDSQERFSGAGMDDFISKPLVMERLEQALEGALQAREERSRQSPTRQPEPASTAQSSGQTAAIDAWQG